MTIRINPSILSADFGRLAEELQRISNADMVHVDVMDAHFVPNLTIGPVVVEKVQQYSPIPLDVHLMIADPDRWAAKYAELGAASVTFHIEPANDPQAIIHQLHSLGSRAGIALKPGTPVEPYLELLPLVDQVLVMTVEPGFGGQSFMPDTMPKLRQIAEYRKQHDLGFWLQVDGGITLETISVALLNGADTFVAGSSVYGAESPAGMIEMLRNQAD